MTNKIKVVLEVELDNESGWIGVEDYKDGENVISDLDAFNRMVEQENTTPFHLLMELGAGEQSTNTQSRFISVSDTWVLEDMKSEIQEMESCLSQGFTLKDWFECRRIMYEKYISEINNTK